MRDRDEKPIAATALVVVAVLGIGTLIRVFNTYEASIIGHQHPKPLVMLAGK